MLGLKLVEMKFLIAFGFIWLFVNLIGRTRLETGVWKAFAVAQYNEVRLGREHPAGEVIW